MTTLTTIVLATRNRDKIREIERILRPLDVVLVTLDRFDEVPEAVEDGETLEENAVIKARAVRDATGLPALADDTGLEVDALDGRPGVYSARFAGDDATYADNTAKLLGAMAGVGAGRRGARFRGVVALALDEQTAEAVRTASAAEEQAAGAGDVLVAEGILDGRIAGAARGSGGFGYDPVFEVARDGRTLAEMTLEEKNATSHRYRALVEMRELLARLGIAGERKE